jgi:hypothetical protein
VTAGQPVPPPFVTAVARIVRDSDGATMCEARKRVFIPQVVKIVYDADAAATVKAGVSGTSGTIIQPVSDAEWDTMRMSIPSGAQNLINYTGANIRFVGDSAAVTLPYKTVRLRALTNLYFGVTSDWSFMNATSGGQAFINIGTLYNNFPTSTTVMEGAFSLPVTPNEIRLHCIRVAVHESGHMFGLVANNNVLGGDPGKHNSDPNGSRVMDDGSTVTYEKRFGRVGSWGWLPLNANYLKFVFPKE